MDVKIKLFDPACEPFEHEDGDWIDLRCRKDMTVVKGEIYKIPLGIAMDIPKGYEAVVLPRSSTFRKYGILQANSMAVIDNSYNGPDDEWFYPVFCAKGFQKIPKGDRICQFRIQRKQPKVSFIKSDLSGNTNRGGDGSTGRQ